MFTSVFKKDILILAGGVAFAVVWTATAYEMGNRAATRAFQQQLSEIAVQSFTKQLALQKKVTTLETDLIHKKTEVKAIESNYINKLRNADIRLRKKFTCKDVTASAPDGDNADAGSGLSKEDAEFLIREAGRADRVVRQLQAAQEYIRAVSKGE